MNTENTTITVMPRGFPSLFPLPTVITHLYPATSKTRQCLRVCSRQLASFSGTITREAGAERRWRALRIVYFFKKIVSFLRTSTVPWRVRDVNYLTVQGYAGPLVLTWIRGAGKCFIYLLQRSLNNCNRIKVWGVLFDPKFHSFALFSIYTHGSHNKRVKWILHPASSKIFSWQEKSHQQHGESCVLVSGTSDLLAAVTTV